MDTKYKLDVVEDFEFDGRIHALALSQETLLTSSPKVMQFACASSNHKIYLFESGFKDHPEKKVIFPYKFLDCFLKKDILLFNVAGTERSYGLHQRYLF